MSIHAQYVGDWVPNDSLANLILGIQMTQATGMRHVVELNRTRWPQATGICYYKLNDNNPASSWSTVDWYGAPKIAYHILQQAYAPPGMPACCFRACPWPGEPVELPVFLLDDAFDLEQSDWKVRIRAFSQHLAPGRGAGVQGGWRNHGSQSGTWGSCPLNADQTFNIPLLVVADVIKGQSVGGSLVLLDQFHPDSGGLSFHCRVHRWTRAGTAIPLSSRTPAPCPRSVSTSRHQASRTCSAVPNPSSGSIPASGVRSGFPTRTSW